jgi:acetoin utilization deacetylase AcuC-like enzyme
MLKIAYAPNYHHPLPKGHRFPMEKYSLVPQQLLYEGSCDEENFFEPGKPDIENILAVHSEKYVKDLLQLQLDKSAVRKMGFPLSEGLVQRELSIVQGTIQNTQFAIQHGISMNIAGGTHHAYSSHGEGFCLLNDQAIAAKYLLKKYKTNGQIASKARNWVVKKILIVDLDVHQGNGTAKIFENDESVFTFSMHGAGNYPFKKEKSDLDIALPDGTEDSVYLEHLQEILPTLIDKEKPDFIFYLSGVDVLKTDKLGRLGLSIEGCKQRDEFVLQSCKNHQIPVQVSMGGGYSPDIRTIVEAHANTFRAAQDIYF